MYRLPVLPLDGAVRRGGNAAKRHASQLSCWRVTGRLHVAVGISTLELLVPQQAWCCAPGTRCPCGSPFEGTGRWCSRPWTPLPRLHACWRWSVASAATSPRSSCCSGEAGCRSVVWGSVCDSLRRTILRHVVQPCPAVATRHHTASLGSRPQAELWLPLTRDAARPCRVGCVAEIRKMGAQGVNLLAKGAHWARGAERAPRLLRGRGTRPAGRSCSAGEDLFQLQPSARCLPWLCGRSLQGGSAWRCCWRM